MVITRSQISKQLEGGGSKKRPSSKMTVSKNEAAKDLRTPEYKKRVVKSKKTYSRKAGSNNG